MKPEDDRPQDGAAVRGCRPDPNHPNMKRATAVISEIIWQYVRTHTPEECMALKAQTEEDLKLIKRLCPPPRPILSDREE